MVDENLAINVSTEEKSEDQASDETFLQWVDRSTWREWIEEVIYFSLVSIVYGGFLWAVHYFS